MPTAPARRSGSDAAASGRARAWGWVAHLEAGGTTPWLRWREQPTGDVDIDTDTGPAGRWLPGAQQLELLRRLNQVGRPDRVLARRVLGADAVGRGRHDVELAGVASSADFGPEPADPAGLVDDDLLRVAVGLLAEDLARPDPPPPPPPRPPPAVTDLAGTDPARPAAGRTRQRVRLRRTRYRLVGDPELAAPRRALLTADGRPPGGRGATVLVLGTDLATMLAHAWTAGAFAEGGPSWPDYLAAWRRRSGVPRRVDLPAVAARWRGEPGAGRVEVVLDPTRVPQLLRLPRSAPTLADPPPLPAAALDLARRTAGALALLVPPDERNRLLATRLRPRLELLRRAGRAPVVPVEHQTWVTDRAERMRDRLARAGHPVTGDLDALVPSADRYAPKSAASPLDADPLGIAIVLLLGGTAV